MADLEQALDRLLADPEAMAQIMDLAGKLGGSGSGPGAVPDDPEDAPPEDPVLSGAALPPELDQLAPLLSPLRGGGGADPRSEALLSALRPYLSESRRRKLDRAMRLSALARAARAALGNRKEGASPV